MNIFDVLSLALGLSLFLFGMNIMGEALKKSAGAGLKSFLGKMTSGRFRGFLLGALVTAVIQSSSATTVMVVGFVNSGTMLLSQAIGVIMGANVGTSVTSWITALSGLEGGSAVGSALEFFKPSTFTPVLAITGILLYSLGRGRGKKNVGSILLGFSVLMLGMDTMSDAVRGLSENEGFRSILLMFENPLLGLLAGLVLTAIVQSSSASIGILQSFTATGAITFGNAVPIIMGQNIGTCITALLASVGTNKNAKRASVIHLSFNVFGSVLGLGIFYLLKYILQLSFLDGRIDMWGIAAVHTVFNILSFAVLFPCADLLERLAVAVVKDKKGTDEFALLDERLLDTPAIAVARGKELTAVMGETAGRAMELAVKMLKEGYNAADGQRVEKNESAVDNYEDKLGAYFVKISAKSIYENEGREIGAYLQIIGDIERICDHSVNLCGSAAEIKDKKISLHTDTQRELSVLFRAVSEIADTAIGAVKTADPLAAERVESLEDVIDGLCTEIKRRNIERLQKSAGTMEEGFILNDILTDLERISDHSSNIAGALYDLENHRTVELHRHQREYRRNSADFLRNRNSYSEKYRL